MQMLSEDDQNLREMTAEELDAAWDLWFDLAQSTNDFDPPFTHGVFAGQERLASAGTDAVADASGAPRLPDREGAEQGSLTPFASKGRPD